MPSNFPKIPLFVSLIIFSLSCVASVFFYRVIDDKNKEAEQRETKWHTEAERREEIKTLDNSVKIIEGERAELETHFAKSSDAVPFLDAVEGLATRAGVKAEITSVDILKDKTGLMVGMKASGTFAGLYKFLTLLENFSYELEFAGMDMHKDISEEGGGKWNATFKVKLLSFVQ